MILIEEDNFDNIYAILLNMLKHTDIVKVRDCNTKELIDVNICLRDPFSSIMSNLEANQYKYLLNEIMLYLKGTLKASDFEQISKFWTKVKNDNDTVNSNYGYMAFHKLTPAGISQFFWCVEQFIFDKNTRKAVINYNDIFHKFDGNKDLVCTVSQSFLVRDNMLHSYILMRSNDIVRGLTYDLPWFCLVQIFMWLMLKTKYKDLKIGHYNHHALSLHIYKEHFNLLGEEHA